MSLKVQSIKPGDRSALESILQDDQTFGEAEVAVALELIDDAIDREGSDYWVRVATLNSEVAGYICFGPTPMTESTFDLYWIVTGMNFRGQGVAPRLIAAMEAELCARVSPCSIRVETSQSESYGAARRLYAKLEYPEVARFKNFYKRGDDLIVYYKSVASDHRA